MASRKPIVVVAGWIENRGKILLTQRPPEEANGGLWELPGGKVEDGETLQQALRREIKEELNLTVYPQLIITTVCYRYPKVLIHLSAVSATTPSRRITPFGCSNFKWLSPPEILKLLTNRVLDLAPADKHLIRRVLLSRIPPLDRYGHMPICY